jgi:hypothetical protein
MLVYPRVHHLTHHVWQRDFPASALLGNPTADDEVARIGEELETQLIGT